MPRLRPWTSAKLVEQPSKALRGVHGSARSISDDRGVALLMTLLVLIIVTTLAAGMTFSGRTEMLVARNYETAAQALGAAEAGVNHGVEITIANLQLWQANGFPTPSAAITALLEGPDGATGTPATDADNGSLVNLGIPTPPAQTALAGVFSAGYEVRLFDEDDAARGVTLLPADIARIGEDNNAFADVNNTLIVRAIGYAADNTSVMLEAMIRGDLTDMPAIVVGGSLTWSGNGKVEGDEAGIHTNVDLTISQNPEVEGDATATGIYVGPNPDKIDGVTGGGYEEIPIAAIQAIAYKPNADYLLTSRGRMNDADGNLICDASIVNALCQLLGYGWVYNPGVGWSIPGNSAPAGTYYVERETGYSQGKATVSGNPNSTVSIIAEGSIEISGNPQLTAETAGLLFVTDGDLKWGGNGRGEGSILIHEQLNISGNPNLTVNIVVEDATSADGLVTLNTVSGNPSITYDGGGVGGSVTAFAISAWREMR